MAINTFTGATNNSWGTATNWSQGTVPTANDGHVTTFDAASPNCSVTTTARVCNHLDLTNYPASRTITLTTGITISGNLSLGANLWGGAAGLTINANSTWTSNGNSLPVTLTLSATHTHTLADNWTITSAGQFTLSSASGVFTLNGNQLTLNCNLTNSLNVTIQGTTKLVLGTMQFANQAMTATNNIDLNGNVTWSNGDVTYSTGTMTWISGTWTNALMIGGSCTLNLAGVTSRLTVTATATITLTSALLVSTLTFNAGTTTFAGAFGFTTANYTCITAGLTQIMNTANNYIVTTALTLTGTAASKITVKSNSAGNRVNFYLQSGGTHDVGFVIATDLNSASGVTIWNYKGTLSNDVNWNLLTNPVTLTRAYTN